jgi:2-polyprenyl-3-methyl-5-hydroxy-6-metoxy-1,4-benzoquinol methylase
MVCPICKSSNIEVIFQNTIESSEWYLDGVHYNYIRCNNCGFIQSDPIPPETALLRYYQEQYSYEWFARNIYFKRLQARHRLYKIRKHLKGRKRILDFGCGHGFFVEQLVRKNFEGYGFDIGSDKIIQQNNARITNKSRLDEYHETGFDAITVWHTLEHMRDHDVILQQLRKRLNPGGALILAVPNSGSLSFKLYKQKWSWLQQPFVHINHYNTDNLSRLLANHGFSVCETTTTDTWDQNLYDRLISALFYKNKSRNKVRQFGNRGTGNFLFLVNQAVRLLFTPVSYFSSFIRKRKNEGNELLIIAKKINEDF